MATTLKSIKRFFGKDAQRIITRGKNLIDSGHVEEVTIDKEYLHIQGVVRASKTKSKLYKPWFELKKNGNIVHGHCECARAEGLCAHMAAVLIHSTTLVSPTDMPCRWSWRAPPKDTSVQPVELLSSRNKFRPVYEPLSSSTVQDFAASLAASPGGSGAGFVFLLAEEPTATPENDAVQFTAPRAEPVLLAENFDLNNPEEYVFAALRVSWQQIIFVAKSTKLQSGNPEWAAVRFCRLTASKFGAILRAMRSSKGPSTAFLTSLVTHKNLNGVKSIEWGKTHEKVAVKEFSERSGLHVENTGIWLHEDGVLGASPDGLIGEDRVLEVKCPYSYRSLELEKALSDKKAKTYVVYREDEQWVINSKHDYIHQIQAALHFTKREEAVLVLWTSVDLIAFPIAKDHSWADTNVPVLHQFYFKHFVPFVRARQQVAPAA